MSSAKIRFLCVCLSPAIDATVQMDSWPTDGCVIKNARDVYRPGGKGLNVARLLAQRGSDVACTGILGRDNAAIFEDELMRCGIRDLFIRVSGATRLNEMFVTPQGSFKVNRPAPNGGLKGIEDLNFDFADYDVMIASGSLPDGWRDDTYFTLIAEAKRAGLKTVLDASGVALREGIKARPNVVKPNREECESLVDFELKSHADFLRATAMLKEYCDCPIISDGANGCWFDGAFIKSPEVEVFDTTGAGDALLAEWCWRKYECGDSSADAAKSAVRAGADACMKPRRI